MNEVETKPLTKHISAAINAIQKEIDRKQKQVDKLVARAAEAQHQSSEIVKEMVGLEEQISKLKGE